MEPDGSLWLYLILLVLLILINAFFAMSEIAVISLNDNRLRRLAEDGDKKAKTIVGLVSQPSKFLAAIQVGVTVSGLLASAVAADRFVGYIVYWLRNVPVSPDLLRIVSLVVITLLLSFFTLVFGELVPKRIAMNRPESISFAIAKPLSLICFLERPFVSLLAFSTNLVLRLFGIKAEEEPEQVTEEEIRMMVDVGNEKGVIEQSEKEMINNIFEFDDRTAGEVMTHRTELEAVENTASLQEIILLATETGYSRIPVYEEDVDNIVGILYVKDLLPLILEKNEESFHLADHMREPLYVPESNRCKELFKEFKEKKIQMAVVVDEYGGTSGIVTMEDLLESIVGNIQDEYDNEEAEFSKEADNKFMLDGSISLGEVERLLEITLPDEVDYDTLGGLITDILGRIPDETEQPSVELPKVTFTVLRMEDRRIAKVLAEKKESLSEPESEEK